MSRTDSTMPYRIRVQDGTGGRQYQRRSRPGVTRYFRQKYWKSQRQRERASVSYREDPAPSTPRHSVLWDLW